MANSVPLPSIERFGSEAQLESYLVTEAVEQYESLFGKAIPDYYYPRPYFSTQNESVSLGQSTATVRSNAASRDFSQTNTQEQGVDEADLVETDGEFIYQVDGQELTIVDARNPGGLKVTDQESLKDLGRIDGAYLYGDQLTVVSSSSFFPVYRALSSFAPYPTYDPTVKITVFDVSNPYDIKLKESSELDGTLLSSRAIEDKVYVVTQDSFGLPAPKRVPNLKASAESLSNEPTSNGASSNRPSSGSLGSPELSALTTTSRRLWYPPRPSNQRYETKKEYLNRIEGQELELSLPEFTTTNGNGKTVRQGLLNEATDIYRPLNDKSSQMASISVFDVDDNRLGPDESIGLPSGYQRNIYMSKDSLYLVRNNWWNGGKTGLLKVDLDSLNYVARGEVAGRTLNQFSLDEEDGYLRVATTEGFGRKANNGVSILQQQGQTLKTVGSISDIAPGETIRSARFQDDYGFLVTFRQVDPFYTLDFSNPTNPKVAGELKLPGFSQYLQVIENEGRQQVLGVGVDADEVTGRSRGLKLSLFDVENFSNPTEVDSYLFEGKYSSSEAQWDQQAVGYYTKYDTLAIPFSNSVGGQGLRVFDVDAQDGFRVIGDISHDKNRIRRSLVIGDDLYAISAEKVTVHDIKTLALIDEVSWTDYSSGPIRLNSDPRVFSLDSATLFSAAEAIA